MTTNRPMGRPESRPYTAVDVDTIIAQHVEFCTMIRRDVAHRQTVAVERITVRMSILLTGQAALILTALWTWAR